jgi:hypothetical protein
MSQTQQAKEKAIRIVPIINLNNRKKQSNEMTKLSSMFTLLAVFASSTEAFKPIGTTFGTYMIADYLSNFIQHPTQKMDYGICNQLIGREVDRKWWGTRWVIVHCRLHERKQSDKCTMHN